MQLDQSFEQLVDDYHSNPKYRKRIVAFYDILGWRTLIEEAGDDRQKLGDLRRTILKTDRVLQGHQRFVTPNIAFSSFSDNIVISAAPRALDNFLGLLASFQLLSATQGVLIRGGVTIGKIYHDKSTVFGPALNHAYALERSIAVVPRIILDQTILEALRIPGRLIGHDGTHYFLDPFTHFFAKQVVASFGADLPEDYVKTIGIGFDPPSTRGWTSELLLKQALLAIKTQLMKPHDDRAWSKIAWVYDRLAQQLGVPPSSSYPRVRPIDVV